MITFFTSLHNLYIYFASPLIQSSWLGAYFRGLYVHVVTHPPGSKEVYNVGEGVVLWLYGCDYCISEELGFQDPPEKREGTHQETSSSRSYSGNLKQSTASQFNEEGGINSPTCSIIWGVIRFQRNGCITPPDTLPSTQRFVKDIFFIVADNWHIRMRRSGDACREREAWDPQQRILSLLV